MITAIKTIKICLFCFLTLPFASFATFPVFDASALHESISQKVAAIEQWATDNANQIKQLQELVNTYELEAKNSIMPMLSAWQDLQSLHEDSLSLLHASASVWQEFGDANRYLASFKRSDAWNNCIQSGHCNFKKTLRLIDNTAIDFATKSYQNAELMQEKLKSQIIEIQKLNLEARSSTGRAASLDALSKINSSISSSLVDLNLQTSTLVKLLSHDLAAKNNEDLATKSSYEIFMQTDEYIKSPHINLSINDLLKD